MRVLVSSWLGSTNLGDELVFRGLLTHLRAMDAEVTAISVDPDHTERVHGVRAVRDRDPAGIRAAGRASDLIVFGGGGLLQDQSSRLNLPYHLGRLAIARSTGTPTVSVGLGVGPFAGASAGLQVRRALRDRRRPGGWIPVAVRDDASAAELARFDIPSIVTADLALALVPPTRAVRDDTVVVCLRPWAVGGRLPARDAWRQGIDDSFARSVAAGLDALHEATGARVEFLALQPGRDDVVHDLVALHMRTPTTSLDHVCPDPGAPDLDDVLGRLGSARIVLSMRYHAGIGALLGARPSLLIGYSPKVDSLAAEAMPGLRLLERGVADLANELRLAWGEADARAAVVAGARRRLQSQESGNLALLRG